MKIHVLGNGGALNNGLPYNSFLINNQTLIETPPDIMLSINREKIDTRKITEIYISHQHGDHSFGFPFLALRLFCEKHNNPIKLYSPGNCKDYFMCLAEKALSKCHPCLDWITETIEFNSVDVNSRFQLQQHDVFLYNMDHFTETYGFVLKKENVSVLAYIADTLWCQSVKDIIATVPKCILVDLNGEAGDKIHLSEKELVEKALNDATSSIFYGTHLRYQKTCSSHEKLKYTVPGLKIEI